MRQHLSVREMGRQQRRNQQWVPRAAHAQMRSGENVAAAVQVARA